MTIPAPLLEDLRQRHLGNHEGALAAYIPELTKADPACFGVAVAGASGQLTESGDSRVRFTLQSVSKPFAYALALEDHGTEAVRARVGVEPTGDAFNSIIELEKESHRPYNPMINSGAIAVSGMIRGNGTAERLERIQAFMSRCAGRRLEVDETVYRSERETGHRNRAIAHLLRHFGVLDKQIEETLDVYFMQCSILVDTRDLALMAATLANRGVHPVTGERVFSSATSQDVLSLMFSCGMYDTAGKWAYQVGLPAKSGVSGGLMAVVPGRMGIASYSPLLDRHGHSVRGEGFFKDLSERLNLSVFAGAS